MNKIQDTDNMFSVFVLIKKKINYTWTKFVSKYEEINIRELELWLD